MTTDEVVPHLLTYAEVATYLNRSVSYVERLVRQNRIPHVKKGKSVRFDRWEILRWLQEEERKREAQGDNRIRPARPLPKGGAQYVFPSETLGDVATCWCGDVASHDWPGKSSGAPHPHDHEGIQQVVVVSPEQEEPDSGRIERKNLRGYHGALKNFIAKCVNEDGLRYRIGTRSDIVLYPPDGSRPISVFARNSDTQMRSLRQWYAAHVEPYREERMTEAVRTLAEATNDPVEHPLPPEPQPEPEPEPEPDPEPEPTPEAPPNQSTGSGEWVTYRTGNDVEIPNFETNGVLYRCRLCLGTPSEYVSTERTGIGGHNRMNHRDRTNLRTPEALAKSTDTRRFNRLQEQVVEANRILTEALGVQVADPKRVAAMTADLERLRQEVATQRKRADDAEAKLQLMREAFQGLE